MLIDAEQVFSNDQAITASAASTNHINFQSVKNLGVPGVPQYLVLTVTEAFTDSSSDSTVTPSIETDDNAAFSSAATLRTLPVFAALTPAGTTHIHLLEPGSKAGAFEKYMRLYYTVANGNLTTGKIFAWIGDATDLQKVYPSGFSIS